jgi:2'-hydroxyisoflavone reductase
MRILVIGGTVFVGRHFAEIARDAGHHVTVFHRGTKGAGIVPGVNEIFGDRDGGLDALGNAEWDAVVDSCGYVPRIVRQSVQALTERADRYVFVSTISVYRFDGIESLPEDAPKQYLEDPTVEQVTGETYGGLKVICEQEVEQGFADHGVQVRAGLIAGPYDPTNRFTYWVDRFGRGGPVLVPTRLDAPLQTIDARDLSAFMLHAIEDGLSGPYNVCGPVAPATFGDMIEACRTLNPEGRPVPIDPETMEAYGVTPWTDLPLVLPFDGSADTMNRGDNSKALAAGLQLRPWAETVQATWEWRRSQPDDVKLSHGMDRARELEVLAKLGEA